jgi:hypothetical protein
MLKLHEVLPAVHSALLNGNVGGVVSFVDYGYGDSRIDDLLSTVGFCLAVQPIFGWTPLAQEVSEIEGATTLQSADVAIRFYMHPNKFVMDSLPLGDTEALLPNGEILLPDGTTETLYEFLEGVVQLVTSVGADETVRALTHTGGVITNWDSGMFSYDLSFLAKCEV